HVVPSGLGRGAHRSAERVAGGGRAAGAGPPRAPLLRPCRRRGSPGHRGPVPPAAAGAAARAAAGAAAACRRRQCRAAGECRRGAAADDAGTWPHPSHARPYPPSLRPRPQHRRACRHRRPQPLRPAPPVPAPHATDGHRIRDAPADRRSLLPPRRHGLPGRPCSGHGGLRIPRQLQPPVQGTETDDAEQIPPSIPEPAMNDACYPFRRLARNNRLANYRLLAACSRLAPGEFAATRTSFFPSIRATLNHILTIDWFYVDALEGGSLGPDAWEPAEPFTRLADLQPAQA